MSNKHKKLSFIIIGEMQIKITVGDHFIPVRSARLSSLTLPSVDGSAACWVNSTDESKLVQPLWTATCCSLVKLKMSIP